jgi:aspartyl/glutamyl-tRNA(Asn/Gln) amidotransferase C subunit
LAHEIAAVLTYASSLQNIAQKLQAPVTEGEQPYENVMREDIAIPEDTHAILQQAPEREGNYFVVPRIIKQD